jgi:hypothetical protein
MATLIPDDRTLETMSALATLADRGEAPTFAALAAEIRAQRDWCAQHGGPRPTTTPGPPKEADS